MRRVWSEECGVRDEKSVDEECGVRDEKSVE